MTRLWNAIIEFLAGIWTRIGDVLTEAHDLALDLPLAPLAIAGALVAVVGAALVLAHRHNNR